MMNTYMIYFTDGTTFTVRASNEDDARFRAGSTSPGKIISEIRRLV